MRSSAIGILAALAGSAAAFSDTSPFFLWSTAHLSNQADVQLQSRHDVMESAEKFLSTCPTDAYMVVEQLEVDAQDFTTWKSAAGLRKAISEAHVKGKMNVAEVVDGISAKDIAALIQKACGGDIYQSRKESSLDHFLSAVEQKKKGAIFVVDHLTVDSGLDISAREDALVENDVELQKLLQLLPQSHSVVYTTTPLKTPVHHNAPYEPSFEAQEPLHIEMKRQSNYARASNSTVRKGAPLFEKYQFFTPGLFMSILVSLLLLAILSVAINALSSLKVSYGAFDKEMGPAAQRKQ